MERNAPTTTAIGAPLPRVHSRFASLVVMGVLLCASTVTKISAAQTAFVHPGVLHTTADLNRMKEMVAARAEPYTTGWNKVRADPRASLTYTPRPYGVVRRIPDTISYQALNSDAIAAHLNAIQWTVTGDAAHARKAVEILNAWSSTLTTFPSTGDPVLTAGLTGYQLAAAAEIIRATYPQWTVSEQDRVKTMLLTKFYPIFHNFLIYHAADGLPRTNTGVNVHFHTNWDAIAMASMAAIAVFAEDRAKYQEALDNFKNGRAMGTSCAPSSMARPGNSRRVVAIPNMRSWESGNSRCSAKSPGTKATISTDMPITAFSKASSTRLVTYWEMTCRSGRIWIPTAHLPSSRPNPRQRESLALAATPDRSTKWFGTTMATAAALLLHSPNR